MRASVWPQPKCQLRWMEQKVCDAFLGLLKDLDWEVRLAAVTALGRFGDSKAQGRTRMPTSGKWRLMRLGDCVTRKRLNHSFLNWPILTERCVKPRCTRWIESIPNVISHRLPSRQRPNWIRCSGMKTTGCARAPLRRWRESAIASFPGSI